MQYVVGHKQKRRVKLLLQQVPFVEKVLVLTYMLHCPLQSPVVCTPHEHYWSSNYHHTQSTTLLQCTPPPFPLSRLILQLAGHLHSNYKIAGQLHTVKLLTYKCFSTTSRLAARVRACSLLLVTNTQQKPLLFAVKHVIGVLLLIRFNNLTGLQTSIGVTHSYSSCPFLCCYYCYIIRNMLTG